MDAMQKHIFTSSVGDVNTSEPDKLRFYVLGYITEKNILTIDELCSQISGYKQPEITDAIYTFHREGIVEFDGKEIRYKNSKTDNIEGVGVQ